MGSSLSVYLLSPGTDQTPGQEGPDTHTRETNGQARERQLLSTNPERNPQDTVGGRLVSDQVTWPSSTRGHSPPHWGLVEQTQDLPSTELCPPTLYVAWWCLAPQLLMLEEAGLKENCTSHDTSTYMNHHGLISKFCKNWRYQDFVHGSQICLCILAAKKYSFQANDSALHWEGFLVLQNPWGSLYLRTSAQETVKPKYNTINYATEIRSGQPVLGLWFLKDFTKSLLHEKKKKVYLWTSLAFT